MISATPASVRNRGARVKLVPFKSKEDTDRNGIFQELHYHTYDQDGMRNTFVRVYNQNKLWVLCSCPYFRYTSEVALAIRNSSTIKYSDGSMPKETNPKLKPIVCKHVIAVIMDLLRNHLLPVP